MSVPGQREYERREERWDRCYDYAQSEVEDDPELFNKKYRTNISPEDWKTMISEEVFAPAILDGLAIERAEQLESSSFGLEAPDND